jgi:hypothetical protein
VWVGVWVGVRVWVRVWVGSGLDEEQRRRGIEAGSGFVQKEHARAGH